MQCLHWNIILPVGYMKNWLDFPVSSISQQSLRQLTVSNLNIICPHGYHINSLIATHTLEKLCAPKYMDYYESSIVIALRACFVKIIIYCTHSTLDLITLCVLSHPCMGVIHLQITWTRFSGTFLRVAKRFLRQIYLWAKSIFAKYANSSFFCEKML